MGPLKRRRNDKEPEVSSRGVRNGCEGLVTTRITTLPYPPLYHPIKGEVLYSFTNFSDEMSAAPPKALVSQNDGRIPIDLSSQQGKFGWSMVGQEYLPYIIRGGENFCAVRIIETHILNKHFGVLHSDIYSCTSIRSYYLTESEADLLTSINQEHCEGRYGKAEFGRKDLIVKMEDVGEFYKFLNFCYNKLISPHTMANNTQCGFLRINGESVIAYTVKDGEKYVPLFYFDGVSDSLKTYTKTLNIWELAYLKFCCKIQGIKKEFLENSCNSVVKLSDLKVNFPAETKFEEFWLHKQADGYLLGDKICPK
ncbi:uncharacterized protein [Halyomorpha halys]|uniref:uncharacterized protein isoform X2 n=1 Tax=Halyomorpha halys TaxID=286706 RepID=UPI0006D5067F|nr:uncharacterized protein LOC106685057 isoform X2 [Halyomorpha halys]